MNLGWSGGLHRARALTDAELLVWVQDDMVPEPGWLDALVDAADAHPKIGGFGSVRVDAEGRPVPPNAGSATPHDAVELWNDTDSTTEWPASEVTTHDWVTSTGFLTRAAAWDELGGTDPRFWPVTHGDKDYCTHLRCHGWDVALVSRGTSPARRRPVRAHVVPCLHRALAGAVVQPPLVRGRGRARGWDVGNDGPSLCGLAGLRGVAARDRDRRRGQPDGGPAQPRAGRGDADRGALAPGARGGPGPAGRALPTGLAGHQRPRRDPERRRWRTRSSSGTGPGDGSVGFATGCPAPRRASVPPPTWRSRVRGRLRGWTHDG